MINTVRVVAAIAFVSWAGWASADSMSAGDWRSCQTRDRMGEISGNHTCIDVTGCYGSNCWVYSPSYDWDNDPHWHPTTDIESVLMTTASQPQLDRIEAMLCALSGTRLAILHDNGVWEETVAKYEYPDAFKECKP